MASRILVWATEANPSLLKGSIVSVAPVGWNWGAREVPPNYVYLDISDAFYNELKHLSGPLVLRPKINVVSALPLSGDYTLQIVSVDASVTRERVEEYLSQWNAVYQSHDATSVTFTWNLAAGIQSTAFWGGKDLTGIVFPAGTYAANGDLTQDIDYTARPDLEPNEVARQCINRGLDVISHSGRVIRVLAEPDDLRAQMERDLQDRGTETLISNRYAIGPEDVDTIVSNGNQLTVPVAQLQSNLIDLANG